MASVKMKRGAVVNWFGWLLLIVAVGGVLWWLSSGARTTVQNGPANPPGRDVARDEERTDDGLDGPAPH